MKLNRKAIVITSVCGSGLALAGAAQMNTENRVAQDDKTQVGVVQSDLVFQSYQGAADYQQQSQTLQQEFGEAQQQGDQQKMQEIQSRYAQMQMDLQQKFDNDLKKAAEKVADNKEVDFIVTEVIYQTDKVTEVDLTNDLIEEMNGGEDAQQPQGWPQQDD